MTLLASQLAAGQSNAAPGDLAVFLRPGMALVYSSDGVESPPWAIDSVQRLVSVGPHEGCVRIRLRTSPAQAVPDTRQHCVDGATMMNWDERAGTLRPARPLGARAVLEIPQANGGRVRYETGDLSVEQIPHQRGPTTTLPTAVGVLPTTVTTFDSAGRIVRRLRERFSITLATATGGVFEIPDSTQAGGWRVQRRFELVAIRQP